MSQPLSHPPSRPLALPHPDPTVASRSRFGCSLGLAATFADSVRDTWFFSFGYCWDAPVEAVGYTCVPLFERYVTTIYWAMMLITGIGGATLESGLFSAAEKIVRQRSLSAA